MRRIHIYINLLSSLLICNCFILNSQVAVWQTFNTAGSESVRNGVDYSYSIGNVFCSYLSETNKPAIIQGYQHPPDILSATKIVNFSKSISVKAYPNPTEGKVWIVINDPGGFAIRVFDIRGNLVNISIVPSGNETKKIVPFDLSNNTHGLYFFNIFKKEERIAIVKIIKI